MSAESPRAPSPTLDTAHLDRQTMGDSDLRREVLLLLDTQLEGYLAAIPGADEKELATIAHTIKGAARGTGAFALGEAAAALELRPGDADARRLLLASIGETRAAVAVETAGDR
jgi:HPt (histidine-containing phosphotransfer) domain-containing protein